MKVILSALSHLIFITQKWYYCFHFVDKKKKKRDFWKINNQPQNTAVAIEQESNPSSLLQSLYS